MQIKVALNGKGLLYNYPFFESSEEAFESYLDEMIRINRR